MNGYQSVPIMYLSVQNILEYSTQIDISETKSMIHSTIYFRISYERVSISANYLMERTKHRPKIAIICGSGLGNNE